MMRSRARLVVESVVVMAALLLPAFATPPAYASDGGWKLGFSFGLDDTPIYAQVLKPAQLKAAELGITLVEGAAKSDCTRQIADMNEMVNAGVKAVTFLGLCGDTAAYDPVLAKARSLGVKTISYAFVDPGADGSITFDETQAGTEMGADALAWITRKYGSDYSKFSWGILECSFAPSAVKQRYEIPIAMITKATGKKPRVADCANTPARARAKVAGWLRKDPNLDMVLGFVDTGAIGAAQAFKESGAKPSSVYVAGIDGQAQALQMMLKDGPRGPYKASYASPLAGPIQVSTAYGMVNGTGPSTVVLGYTPLRASNPAGIRKWINTQYKPWGIG